jgi:hypothetical protein
MLAWPAPVVHIKTKRVAWIARNAALDFFVRQGPHLSRSVSQKAIVLLRRRLPVPAERAVWAKVFPPRVKPLARTLSVQRAEQTLSALAERAGALIV